MKRVTLLALLVVVGVLGVVLGWLVRERQSVLNEHRLAEEIVAGGGRVEWCEAMRPTCERSNHWRGETKYGALHYIRERAFGRSLRVISTTDASPAMIQRIARCRYLHTLNISDQRFCSLHPLVNHRELDVITFSDASKIDIDSLRRWTTVPLVFWAVSPEKNSQGMRISGPFIDDRFAISDASPFSSVSSVWIPPGSWNETLDFARVMSSEFRAKIRRSQ